jgi:hypothetical protein
VLAMAGGVIWTTTKAKSRKYPSGAADVAEVERGYLRGIEVGDDQPTGADEAINHDKAEILRCFRVDRQADGKYNHPAIS